MIVVVTNELALPTGGVLASEGGVSAIPILLCLTVAIGAIQFVLGLLRLGGMVRSFRRALSLDSQWESDGPGIEICKTSSARRPCLRKGKVTRT